MKPVPKHAMNRKAAIGTLIVLDADGDPHYIPWMQVRDITDWVAKWGKGVSQITLPDSGTERSSFKVGLSIEEVFQAFQDAAGGAIVDLRNACGKDVYEQTAGSEIEQRRAGTPPASEPRDRMVITPAGGMVRISAKKPNF